jgi:hypothetical protein
MEIDAPDWPIVFFETINDGTDAVVPSKVCKEENS